MSTTHVINILDMVSYQHEVELDIHRMKIPGSDIETIYSGAIFCDFNLILQPQLKPLQFVWPSEGEMNEYGFKFNQSHRQFEPLFVDNQTLHLLKTCFELLRPDTKERVIISAEKSRDKFCRFIELFWSKV